VRQVAAKVKRHCADAQLRPNPGAYRDQVHCIETRTETKCRDIEAQPRRSSAASRRLQRLCSAASTWHRDQVPQHRGTAKTEFCDIETQPRSKRRRIIHDNYFMRPTSRSPPLQRGPTADDRATRLNELRRSINLVRTRTQLATAEFMLLTYSYLPKTPPTIATSSEKTEHDGHSLMKERYKRKIKSPQSAFYPFSNSFKRSTKS